MSLEKEVFPFMAQDGELFAFDLEGMYYTHCLERGELGYSLLPVTMCEVGERAKNQNTCCIII